jgi:hypothetical protein
VETNEDTTSAYSVKNADTMKADKKGDDSTIPTEATDPKNESGSTSSKDSVNDKKGDDWTIPTEAADPKNEGSSTSSKDSVKDVAPTKTKRGVTTTSYILLTRSLRLQRKKAAEEKEEKE